MAQVVTGLRDVRSGKVAVELDGVPWRVLPVEAVVRAGLRPGVELDRPLVRRLRSELRRAEGLAVAGHALRRRDHSRRSLDERLARRGFSGAAREETLGMLERLGFVDDARAADGRARVLAERGAGDALIRDDLERHGFGALDVERALGALQAESVRARAIVAARGSEPRVLRRLAAKGFSPEVLDGLVADTGGDELG